MHLLAVASCFVALIGFQTAPTQSPDTLSQKWRNVETKIGAQLSVPSDYQIAPTAVPAAAKPKPQPKKQATKASTKKEKKGKRSSKKSKKAAVQTTALPTVESYSLKAGVGCTLSLCRIDISSDEDPEDSIATKLEDVVFNQVDLSEATVSRMSYATISGWPAVDIEGKRDDQTTYRYRVCRGKSSYYSLMMLGQSFPDKEIVDRLFNSFKLPKSTIPGKLTGFGPKGQMMKLAKDHISIWTPIPLTSSEDVIDFTGEEIVPTGFGATFGYITLLINYAELPGSMEDQYDEDALDKVITGKFAVNDEGDHVTFGPFTSYTVDKTQFRTVRFVDETVEGRVDICVRKGKLYLFSASVPRGLLSSPEIVKFFDSIVLQ